MIQKIISAKPQSVPSRIDFVNQQKYAPEKIAVLRNVKILKKHSMICDAEYNPVDFCLNEFILWTPSYLKNDPNAKVEADKRITSANTIAKTARKKNIISLKTNNTYVYLMHAFEWYAYGHLFDTLQRLYPLQDQKLFSPNYLCCDHRRITEFATHLKFLGIDQQNILSFNNWDVIEVPNLVVSFSPAWVGNFTHDTMNWILKRYLYSNDTFKHYSSIHKGLGDFILYLDRQHIGNRGVINNDEVIGSMTNNNYNVYVYKGSENLLETMWLFNNARVVIGGHGAAFINTIFCNPEALILEFCPITRIYQSILHMPKPATNHDLVAVDADENYNIQIDVDFVIEKIRDVL